MRKEKWKKSWRKWRYWTEENKKKKGETGGEREVLMCKVEEKTEVEEGGYK